MFQLLRGLSGRQFTQLSCHSSHLEDGDIDVSYQRDPVLGMRVPVLVRLGTRSRVDTQSGRCAGVARSQSVAGSASRCS
jgi:hypothetical protein